MKILFEKTFKQGRFVSYGEKPSCELFHVHQVHSAIVLPTDTPDLSTQKADGIVGSKDQTLAIKTADCLPVLMMGENQVALVHAGWRGLADGILMAGEVKGIRPLEEFIGPCIHVCCFEVTAEFAQHFPHAKLQTQKDGTLRFDLIQEATQQLQKAFPGIKVIDSGECTCCNKKYPSFRRDKTTQRIWNLYQPLAK